MHDGSMHGTSHHLPTPTLPTSVKSNWLLDFLHRFFLSPTKRARVVALCWVTWFVYRTITIPSRLVNQNERQIQHQGQKRQKLIEARIVHKLPVHGLHADGTDVEYRCRSGEEVYLPKRYRLWGGLNGTRQPLKYPLNQSGVLDFAVHISEMKLRVLIVGNSLGEQLHAGIEEAMCFPINMTESMPPSDRKSWSDQASSCKTKFVGNPNAQWIKEPRIVSTQSGGLLGVIKDNTNMIDTKTRWRGNNKAVSMIVKALEKNADIGDSNANTTGERNGLLDVLVYQFQSGHVDMNDLDEYYLEQAIMAASNFFQATTVIFPTIAWMNNVPKTGVDKWWEVNERIRNFARLYTPNSKNSTVETVHVLDIAALSKIYIESNAKILDISPNETYTLRVESRWESLVAQMCASLPFAEDPRGCSPGMISVRLSFVCTWYPFLFFI